MSIDLSEVAGFMAGHARLLDRRRFDLLRHTVHTTGTRTLRTSRSHVSHAAEVHGVLGALAGYRNDDGGYGWGLEPDLRTPESQPGAALHAFEAFADVAPATSPHAAALCAWLAGVSLADGGLPFALPVGVGEGTAPWWAGADPAVSSLQITSVTAAAAHRVARHDPAVAAHPWLARATRHCLDAIAATRERPAAYVLLFVVRFLDEVYDLHPEAPELLSRMGAHIPPDGRLPVEGGADGESLRPLDFAPFPGTPARDLFAAEVIERDLDRLEGERQQDGGWTVDYARISPAGALEWRGAATVRAIQVLAANGRL
jgi:hypothetical protein